MSAQNGSTIHYDDIASVGNALGVGGFSNPLTGMGMPGFDPSLNNVLSYGRQLTREEQISLFRNYGLLRKVVRNLPRAATYKWGRLTLAKGTPEQIQKVTDALNKIPIKTPLGNYRGVKKGNQEALTSAFLSGNASLVMDADDNTPLDQPLNLSKLRSIDALWLLNRWQLVPDTQSLLSLQQPDHYIIQDGRSLKLGSNTASTSQRIHKTRVLWYRGAEMIDYHLQGQNQGCDDSILQSIVDAFNLFLPGLKGAGRMLVDFDFYIHQIEGLLECVDERTVGKERAAQAQAAIRQRLQFNQVRRSSFRDMVIDKDKEAIINVSRQAGGYSDLLEQIRGYLLASTEYPPAVLFGEFSAGLNASGMETSERQTWNDTVAQVQQDKLEDNLLYLIDVLCQAKNGPTKGKQLDGVGWQWLPLYSSTPDELATLQNTYATMLQTLSAVEQSAIGIVGIKSLWGGTEFNPNLTLPEEYSEYLERTLDQATSEQPEESPEEEQTGAEGEDSRNEDDQIADDALSDETLLDSADTRTDSKPDKYSHINFTPPLAVRKAIKQGLSLHRKGNTGKGLEAATVREAIAIANGKPVTPEKARKGNRFCLRNARFAKAPKDSPAYAAWMLWAGASGASWFAKLVRQMDTADAGEKKSDSQAPAQKDKIEKIMHEFKQGELKSGSGQKVTSRKQAAAIALSQAKKTGKKNRTDADTVTWKYGTGTATGKVLKQYDRPVALALQGARIKRNGSKDNPALLIEQEDGSKVLKLRSEVHSDAFTIRTDSEVELDEAIINYVLDGAFVRPDALTRFDSYRLDAKLTLAELRSKVKQKNETLPKGKKFKSFGATRAAMEAFVGTGSGEEPKPAAKNVETSVKGAKGGEGKKYQTGKQASAVAQGIAKKTGGNAAEIEQELKGKIQKAIDKKRKEMRKVGTEPTAKDLRKAAIYVVQSVGRESQAPSKPNQDLKKGKTEAKFQLKRAADDKFPSQAEFESATLTKLKGVSSGAGNVGALSKTTLNGKEYFVKKAGKQETAIEKASYEMAKTLGLGDNTVPVQVYKKGRSSYVVMPFLSSDDLKTIGDVKQIKKINQEDALKTVLFDYMIGNTDRHAANIGVKNGKPLLFDHGLSFHEITLKGFMATTPKDKLDVAVNAVMSERLGYDKNDPESKQSKQAKSLEFSSKDVETVIKNKKKLIAIAKQNKLDTSGIKARISALEKIIGKKGKVSIGDIIHEEPPKKEEKLTDLFSPEQLALLRKKFAA